MGLRYKWSDEEKLNVRTAIKMGNSVSIPLTGLLEEGKKYVIEKEVYSDRNEVKIIIQAVDEVKIICQKWKEIDCKSCEEFKNCELNID
jgi:hypothetical protein